MGLGGQRARPALSRARRACSAAPARTAAGRWASPPEGEEVAADCFLLLLHYAHRRGFSLLNAADRKFTENTLRRWGQPDAEGVVEHEREEG